MDTTENSDLRDQLKQLTAKNKALEGLLENYKYTIDQRNREITELHIMLSAATALQSKQDNQLAELELLQDYIGELQQKAAGANNREAEMEQQLGKAVGTEQQLSDLQQQYTYLATQIANLQAQLLEINNRNLLLQQQTGRVAELESLLENTEEEISALKKHIMPGVEK